MSTGTEVTDCRLEDVVVTEAATLSLLWYLCVIIPHVIYEVFLIFPLKLQIPGCLIQLQHAAPQASLCEKKAASYRKENIPKNLCPTALSCISSDLTADPPHCHHVQGHVASLMPSLLLCLVISFPTTLSCSSGGYLGHQAIAGPCKKKELLVPMALLCLEEPFGFPSSEICLRAVTISTALWFLASLYLTAFRL